LTIRLVSRSQNEDNFTEPALPALTPLPPVITRCRWCDGFPLHFNVFGVRQKILSLAALAPPRLVG